MDCKLKYYQGTTLVKLLFDLHPDIAAIVNNDIRNNEGQFFQTVPLLFNK